MTKGQGQQPAPNLYSKGHPGLRNIHCAFKLKTTQDYTNNYYYTNQPNQMLHLN